VNTGMALTGRDEGKVFYDGEGRAWQVVRRKGRLCWARVSELDGYVEEEKAEWKLKLQIDISGNKQ